MRINWRHEYSIFSLIVIVSTLVKLIDIAAVSLWIDEAYSFLVANIHPYPTRLNPLPETVASMYHKYLAWQPMDAGALIEILKQNVHMPLYYLLLNPWLGWVGNDEFGLRSFSVLFSTLMLLPLYGLATSISNNQKSALWAVFFGAFVPFQLFYAQEGRMYALAMFWAVSAAWALWRLVASLQSAESKNTWGWGCLYSLTILLGVFSHYMFIFYLSFHIVYVVIQFFKSGDKKRYLIFLLPAAISGIALGFWYPIYKIQQQGVWENYHFAKGLMKPIRYLNKFLLMPMEATAGNNIWSRLFYFPLTALGVGGYLVHRLIKKIPLRLETDGFLLCWMFIPILFQLFYDITNQTHTTIITRYLVLTAPATALWLGCVLSQYPQLLKRIQYPLIVMVLLYALASVIQQSPVNAHSNKKSINLAANYLSKQLQPGDLLFVNGPLGAPNLMVFYLQQTHPQQPIIYWVKDYNGKYTPMPDSQALQHYKRVWFFNNRSNEKRGLQDAMRLIKTYYPRLTPSLDPYHQFDLYEKPRS